MPKSAGIIQFQSRRQSDRSELARFNRALGFDSPVDFETQLN